MAKHRSTERRERTPDSDAVVARRRLGNLRGGAHARPSAFPLRAARRRRSPAGRTGLLAASWDRREFLPTTPAPPFPNPPFQRVEEPPALGPRHQSAARARQSRQGKAGPRSPTADRDCCPPPQSGHRNRVPCVLRRSPRPRHVPHVTPRTPAPAPEAHSPQRRHRHGRCRPDSPCRGHRERRRERHPQHSASTTRLAPRRDRLHSGSWGHRTLIWHVRAQRELSWRARAGYGEAWHHYSSRRCLSKAMGWTPPDPRRHTVRQGESARWVRSKVKLVFDSISGGTEARIQQNQYVRR